MRRRITLFVPLLLGQCVSASTPSEVTATRDQPLVIDSTPVLIDTSAPTRRRVGALTFVGAWHLTSDTRSFGGLSALDVDGTNITAIADSGAVARWHWGRFGHASKARIARLPPGCGPVRGKTDNDTESLAHDEARQHWWVGYEWRNAICRTDAEFARARFRAPPAMADWPHQKGPESLLRLRDGRFIVFAEGGGDPVRPVVLFDRDPTDPGARVTRLGYRPPEGFDPTDAAQLPDGRILVLNRRFSPWSLFTARLVLLDSVALKPGVVLGGRIIARFEPPVTTDNYEGMSVTVENGRPMVWIVSDDNFMRWQRTLLLKFALN